MNRNICWQPCGRREACHHSSYSEMYNRKFAAGWWDLGNICRARRSLRIYWNKEGYPRILYFLSRNRPLIAFILASGLPDCHARLLFPQVNNLYESTNSLIPGPTSSWTRASAGCSSSGCRHSRVCSLISRSGRGLLCSGTRTYYHLQIQWGHRLEPKGDLHNFFVCREPVQ